MTFLYWFVLAAARSALRATTGLHVVNADKRIESGGAIIAANHTSYLDPPIVSCSYTNELVFLARSSLFTGFGGWLYPKLNAFPIDRDHADIKSMKAILRMLKEGQRILMFPEGTRSPDGTLQKAKPGIGMLLAKSNVPVQPVRIFGGYESWPRHGKYRPHPVTVVIGDPVKFAEEDLHGRSRESYQRLADQLMAAIGGLQVR